MIRLSDLAACVGSEPPQSNPAIAGITEDSRRISPGMLFVAVRGTSLDGHAYIADAVARGAVAVVAERSGTVPAGVPVIRVASARQALPALAACFYGHPSEGLRLVGFTGTFGKTSTSEILRALLEAGGIRTGVLGSLGARYRAFHDPGRGLTTPAPVELHRSLRGLKDAGARTVIMEVTSHALRLERVRGLRFAGGLLAAVLPGEHTDFHRSYDEYVDAKRLFLGYLAPDAALAYDADNHTASRLAAEAVVARTIGMSLEGRDADLQVYDVLIDRHGATFSIGGRVMREASGVRLHSALLGRNHLRNAALALAYALQEGVPFEAVREVLAALKPLRRRMQRYEVAGRTVLDDTAAHSDSLRAVFEVASLLRHEKLVVVYAIRGSRGREINRQNALALGDLTAVHGADALVITASADSTGPSDRAVEAEVDATSQALLSRGGRFVWHDTLRDAVRDALDRTRPGDLIMLIGAQGMNRGRKMLEEMGGKG